MLDAGVVTSPAMGFGEHGEGYMRFSITQAKEKMKEACEKIVVFYTFCFESFSARVFGL